MGLVVTNAVATGFRTRGIVNTYLNVVGLQVAGWGGIC